LQHTPSTQNPVPQSLGLLQVSPGAILSPHWWVIVLQVTGVTQSTSPPHMPAHWKAFGTTSHLLPMHAVVTVGHEPAPSQVSAAISVAGVVLVPGVQDRFRQAVVVPHNRQRAAAVVPPALFPLHIPS
jgi:hypothetical protein